MAWQITSYPALSAAETQSILDWISANYKAYDQAKDDTYTYGPAAAFGDLNALLKYSQALDVIDILKEEFWQLRTSDTVWDNGTTGYGILYNHYLTQSPHFSSFLKFGIGTAGNDSDTLGSEWSDYTLDYYAGGDTVYVGSGGHRVLVNLGLGNDYFQGNQGSDGAFGGDDADTLKGGDAIDILDGGLGDDYLFGEGDFDLLFGNEGNDVHYGGNGDDFIDGGDGSYDIAVFTGGFSEYTVAFNAQGILILEDSTPTRDGTDSLVSIEIARFSDQDIAVSSLPGAPNTAPTSLSISASTFNENISAGTAVGKFSSTDPNTTDTFTYSLVSGSGDSDNAAFTIDGDQLRINASPDYESKPSYSIRVRTTDAGGLTLDKVLAFTVNDLTETTTGSGSVPPGGGNSDQSLAINDIALGTIKGSTSNDGEVFSYSGLIGTDGSFDGLRFSLDSDSYTYFDLTDLISDLDLYLYRDNPTGEENDLLYTSEAVGLESESFFKYLSAGDYAAFVVPYDEYPDGGHTYSLEIDTHTFLENSILPNDPLFSRQWHLFNTGQGTGSDNSDVMAPEAWLYQSSSPDIIVAVIDGGVDLEHPDLKDNIWVNSGEIPDNGVDDDSNGYIDDINGWNFYYDSNIINETSNGDDHGTHVAGTIGAKGNNGIGVTGVTWDTQIMSLTVFEAYKPGAGDILSAIYYAVDNGARIINMSLGLDYEGTIENYIAEFPDDHEAYLQALTYAVDNGTTIVIAAGNDNNSFDTNWISSPAYFSDLIPGVISVAASANNEQKAGYSNYGSLVTITAPGGDFFSSGEGIVEDGLFATYPLEPQEDYEILFDNGYGYMHGTSMAAPVVSGAIALLLQKYPFLTPAQVEEAIVESASTSRDLEGVSRNGGYLNLANLLNYYENDSPSTDIPSNTAPTDLSFTASSFDENIAAGTAIGTLSSTDANAGDTFTYSFVSGTGDTDNAAFTIDGAQLKINASPDYETKSSYSIRVLTTDVDGLAFEKALTLSVNDLTETPTGGSGGSAVGGGGTGGGGGGSSSSPAATVPSAPTSTPISTPSAAPPASPSSVPVSQTPSQESPVLGIQPQSAVTTVQLTTPLNLANFQVRQAFVGTTKPDVITGSDQGEALAGGQGKDRMTGGGGSDGFIFEAVGEFGKRNADVITDFSSKESDKLVVSSEAFYGVSQIKFKSVTGKREVKRMGRSNKNFIYDDKNGMLYFDANGKKDGFGPGGEFAQLLGAPEIGKTDLIVV
jgi:subtilisin family serine protease/Ca2+-binding RTX toxin-like protein